MRCAECDCENGGNECTWIGTKYIPNLYYGWNGGENPAPGKKVMVVLRSVESVYSEIPVASEEIDWEHFDTRSDVVAFKVVEYVN